MKRQSNLAMIKFLSAPCGADVIFWIILFINPQLSFRVVLVQPFVVIYLGSWLAAIFGICIVIDVRHSETSTDTKADTTWGFLAFFIATVLLKVIGFFWGLGLGINAIR